MAVSVSSVEAHLLATLYCVLFTYLLFLYPKIGGECSLEGSLPAGKDFQLTEYKGFA